ncbi:hypothetical protein TSUD_359930 [Trifolium subterraneum]|uniref:Uncharacterized protein n=1 Tax=Trifolium subterraneum TaxID=3900 RepID=A0A2Z6MUX7_TRISU|nr:hypothetical protein TSUD_359930 [Trifolium subterraneum]
MDDTSHPPPTTPPPPPPSQPHPSTMPQSQPPSSTPPPQSTSSPKPSPPSSIEVNPVFFFLFVLRTGNIDIRSRCYQAKVVGTLHIVLGAMVYNG